MLGRRKQELNKWEATIDNIPWVCYFEELLKKEKDYISIHEPTKEEKNKNM